MSNTPKFGKIIDTTTGKGMPGVLVIALGHFRADNPIHGSRAGYVYRVVTRTDEGGNYRVPNTWSHIQVGLPGTGATATWFITAFKPGYAIASDDLTHLKDYVPTSTAESPAAWWLGVVTWVEPIKMHAVELTLPQSAGYYGYIASTGWQDYASLSRPDEIALRKTGADYFLPKICALDPEEEIGWGSNIAPFAGDHIWFDKEIDRLDPDWLKKPTAEGYMIPRHHAKNICNALTQSWAGK
jgi:hypothetical protein